MKRSYINYVLIAALFSIFSMASGQESTPKLRFRTNLSGAQEITDPPGGIITTTNGNARVEFNRALSRANYEVTVRSGIGITLAHLHCASAGVNGPIVVTLFSNPSGQNIEGQLVTGTIENADIKDVSDDRACGVQVNNIAALAFAIRAGKVYVNVHNLANPDGVVRGQLLELKEK
jgi:CHRD domain